MPGKLMATLTLAILTSLIPPAQEAAASQPEPAHGRVRGKWAVRQVDPEDDMSVQTELFTAAVAFISSRYPASREFNLLDLRKHPSGREGDFHLTVNFMVEPEWFRAELHIRRSEAGWTVAAGKFTGKKKERHNVTK